MICWLAVRGITTIFDSDPGGAIFDSGGYGRYELMTPVRVLMAVFGYAVDPSGSWG
jgi:hypothetical protein